MFLFWKTNQTGKKYYCLGETKKVNGKSVRVKEIYLGSADKIYELLSNKTDIEKISTYEYGLTIALLRVIREYGLYAIIKKYLNFNVRGINGTLIMIILLLNKIIEPRSKNSLCNWYDKSVISKIIDVPSINFSSRLFFDFFQKLDPKVTDKIELSMAKQVKKVEDVNCLLCDMTDIETWFQKHEGQELAQYGLSKNGHKTFKIIKISLLITRNNSIPLFSNVYPGNINDVVEFSETVKLLEKRYDLLTDNGKRDITIFIDKGNNSESNINDLEDNGYYFLGRLKPSSNKELLSYPLSGYRDKYSGHQNIISYTKFLTVFGRKRKVVTIFNSETYDKNIKEFIDFIIRRKKQVKHLEEKVNKNINYWYKKDNLNLALERILLKKPFQKLFTYKILKSNKKTSIVVKIDKKENDIIKNAFGKTVLFTNRTDWNPDQIIKAFLDQYLIENQYKMLKSDRIKIRPIRHWTDKSIKADIFISILALQIMNLLFLKLKNNNISLSNLQMLEALENIKVSYYKLKKSPHEFNMINDMATQQKEVFNALKMDNKNLFSYIRKI